MGADSTTGARQNTLLNIVLFLVFLYLFLLSIQLMGSAFKAFGKDFAENLLRPTGNPFVGLLIGLLATSLTQSSSTTTAIIVSLVAAEALGLHQAVPMIMGANIGTTVTNTIVALGQIGRRDDFRRAFGAAVVHDVFNVMSVGIIFPIWYFTNYLDIASEYLSSLLIGSGGVSFSSPINTIVKPATLAISDILGHNGWVMLVVAMALLFVALRYMVKYMKAVIMDRAEVIFEKTIFRTAYHGLVFGMLLTALVQSSSVTTSLIVPLTGAGMITLAQVFPYTLGANIGTTITAILAAMATGSSAGLSVAFSHLLFNISGIICFWWIRGVPIAIARKIAWVSSEKRPLAIVFIALTFFIIPLLLIYILE